MLAVSSFARIGFVSQLLPQHPALKEMQFVLPAALLLMAGVLAVAYALKNRKRLLCSFEDGRHLTFEPKNRI